MDNRYEETKGLSNEKTWLSVVIPIYNAEKYLEKCVDSILAQTESNFEVLLVDDGSTDGSSNICRLYSDKDTRVRYFRKENGGAYQTRIYGAERSQGTYVTFCDADDYYVSKHAFRILHDYLSKGDYAVAQFGYEKKYNHLKQKKRCVNEPIMIGREAFFANEYPRLLCSYWDDAKITTNVANKVYHRRLLSNFPDSTAAEKIFWGDDLIMNLHLLSTCESMLFVPEIIYGYRQRSGGTSKFSPNVPEDINNIKKHQLYYLERYEGANVERIRSTLFSEAAVWFFGHIQQAVKHMSEPEVEKMIVTYLRLPSFVLTREYYLHESDCDWEAMKLLRKADPKAYIASAKVFRNKQTRIDKIRGILLKIYASI